MSGLTQVLNIGASGLEAATAAMQTVSNNTANANTPGYSVEVVSQTDLPGTGVNPGSGAEVTSIQRAYNQFVTQALVAAGSANQAAQVVQSNSETLAAIFPTASGGANGLGAALDGFFAAASALTPDPTSLPERQVLLSKAQALADSFHSAAGQVAANLTAINDQLGAAVQQIDTLTRQIASLNQQIARQSDGNPPNALLDERDQLVQQLGQQVGVTVLPGTNGMLDVYTASGAALVNGTNAYQLSAAADAYGDGNVAIEYGPSGQDVTASLSGGAVGGLLASRAQAVSVQNSLGALAASFADSVNAQQSLGLDLGGKLGQALFSAAGPVAYASSANTGTGTLSAVITDFSQFAPGEFIVSKTASGFEATDTASGTATALGNGPTLTLDGMTITVSGTVQTGDSFKLEPSAATAQSLALATADPSAIAAASPYVATPGAIDASGAVTDTNRGNVQVGVGGPMPASALPLGAVIVPASAFGQSLSIVFSSATNFTVRDSGGAAIGSGSIGPNAGAQIAVALPSPAPTGMVETVNVSAGAAAAGDSFTLTPGGVASNGNITALAGLADQKLASGQTLGDTYAGLVAGVGSYGQEAQAAATAAQGVLTMAQQNQQSVGGVNLDEEATKLVSFQQAYQASAQVIAAAQTLFQDLLAAVQA